MIHLPNLPTPAHCNFHLFSEANRELIGGEFELVICAIYFLWWCFHSGQCLHACNTVSTFAINSIYLLVFSCL